MLRVGLIIAALVFASSCKKKDKDPEPVLKREVVLKDISSKVIIPAYEGLVQEVNALSSKASAFTSSPGLTTLAELKSALKVTWKAWLHASTFEFGPAETVILRSNLNTFPTDTSQINTHISSGTWDLNSASSLDAKGFPAIDFLINGKSDQSVISFFTSTPQAGNYLNALITEIKDKSNYAKNEWTGGAYASTFTSSTGTSVGSPFSLLVNQMNYDLEITKTNRLAIPMGLKTLGTPLPEKTEARYGGYSAELALEHLTALENTFLGNSGMGIYEYLISIEAKYNDGLLADEIKNQFTLAKTAMSAVPDPLHQTVVSNPASAQAAYQEVQKLVILMKNDMASALGVMITYQDNDGD